MIESDELSLTKLSQQDQDFYIGIFTDAELLKYISKPLSTDEAAKSFEKTLKKMLWTPPEIILYCINSKLYNEKIGVIGFKWNQLNITSVEIGVIIKNYQRQGFANKAKTLLIQHAFDEFCINKIIATCDKKNNAANYSFSKLGFIQKQSKDQNKTIWKIIKQ